MRHAREIADVGDRWFLSVASGLGRLGGWARHEANIAADSAVAAFATTVGLAKRFATTGGARPTPTHTADEAQPVEPISQGVAPKNGIGLVPAIPRRGRPSAIDVEGVLPDNSVRGTAGVVPLLQALGRTVASHAHQGYASLQQDDRFWTLIHLVQLLGRPNVEWPNEPNPPGDPVHPKDES